ncbi:hypothetical protein B484DRAFT_161342 [Ochromonadaceae sp. CCMP2298]|nr:hypothetical protein B484DRAFT_161342 [Ochromonadaceae sp. CCMP2298]
MRLYGESNHAYSHCALRTWHCFCCPRAASPFCPLPPSAFGPRPPLFAGFLIHRRQPYILSPCPLPHPYPIVLLHIILPIIIPIPTPSGESTHTTPTPTIPTAAARSVAGLEQVVEGGVEVIHRHSCRCSRCVCVCVGRQRGRGVLGRCGKVNLTSPVRVQRGAAGAGAGAGVGAYLTRAEHASHCSGEGAAAGGLGSLAQGGALCLPYHGHLRG